MQHQYWVTKKSVLRKLGGKEDDCIVSSDAELDAKLELFKSINDSCVHLQRVIDLYQERLCYLAQEENALGRYLKESGKNEKNACAGQIMAIAGKALAYTGHQRLTIRSPLVRLHHEVDTFRARAVTDTKVTLTEMEKIRTEYRAALSWMKSVSGQLDPDTGQGLERFRKAQSFVKSAKIKFDRLTLACLQKVDLLAAARCNMFSHALVPYQNAVSAFSNKAADTLSAAAAKLDKVEPYDFTVCAELSLTSEGDKDKNTFFNADYTDKEELSKATKSNEKKSELPDKTQEMSDVSNLLGEDFSVPSLEKEKEAIGKTDDTAPSSALLELSWHSGLDFFGNEFMPSRLLQENTFNFTDPNAGQSDSLVQSKDIESDKLKDTESDKCKKDLKTKEKPNPVSWLSLFAELDPLANQDLSKCSGDTA